MQQKNPLPPTLTWEADRWSSSAIKLVSAAGVMEGTSKTAFTPSKTMDREQFVASAASLAKN